MATKKSKKEAVDTQPKDIPAGVRLLRALAGHEGAIKSVAFDPQGETLASGSFDHTVKIWEVRGGKLLRTLQGHTDRVYSVAFNPKGEMLASGSMDRTAKVWDPRSGSVLSEFQMRQQEIYSVVFASRGATLAIGGSSLIELRDAASGELLHALEEPNSLTWRLAFDSTGRMLASPSVSKVNLWNVQTGDRIRILEGHSETVWGLTFDPHGTTLATASEDDTIKIWDAENGKLLRTLEGHTEAVDMVAFSPDGRMLASKSHDDAIRLWSCETWETVGVIPEPSVTGGWHIGALAFHPTLPLLATAGSEPGAAADKRSRLVHLWELDYDILLRKGAAKAAAESAVHHTTAKIVLVGDHSVGKSALGHRLIHGTFEKQESTHGQKFWIVPALGKRRADGTECEAILWDFAGQPDYRLVHALFVDNADLALVLFDSSDLRDPLHGVDFWLKQLQTGKGRCPIILVAAQIDRGTSSLTQEELRAFCERHGIVGPISTSARTGAGVEDLVGRMKSLIPWEEKAATVTTTTFKRIKDYVLGLKGEQADSQTIVTPAELRGRLERTDPDWQFTDAEMLTAVGHLENYGYVKRLTTSKGELRILLEPERLNNLASSFVLEARRNPKGLGALEEKRLLAGGYDFRELKDLHAGEREILLDAAALLFLEHNVCFRETDPLRMEPYLVFPELINLKKPPEDDSVIEDGVAYTVSGPTENVFASLVVLLGYTHTFTRTAQWQNNARYEVGAGLLCGFRQEAERDGELDFVLGFGPEVGLPIRNIFQGLFESFLARRNLTVRRFEPVRCINDHLLDRSVVRQRLKEGKSFAFCNDCGEKLTLPAMAEPIQLTREVKAEVESQRRAAEERTRFEQAVFRIRAYAAEQKITPPECFISYAWGVPEHERWVEKRLATDLQKAGIDVLLDRWHNAQIGANIARFVERIEESAYVIVVGTPLYRKKAKNVASAKGNVAAAEWDLAGIRMLATENEKQTVLPVLLAGEESHSFPALVRGRVYADFRDEEKYFTTAFDLILSLYRLPPNHSAVADLRESLRGSAMR